MSVNKNTLAVGCVISYRLHENQSPVNRRKLWRGQVLKVIIDRPQLLDSVIVMSLEDGYENETEFVLLEQIVSIDTQEEIAMYEETGCVCIRNCGRIEDVERRKRILPDQFEGTDLRRYLRSRGVLDVDRAVKIVRDVALLLGEKHQQNIVHGDVQPRNILLGRDGSIALRPPLSFPNVGVPDFRYYAPEQAKGEDVTPATDVYSLGIVLYELLTGHIPFDGDTPVAVAMQHIYDKPISPSLHNPDIPQNLEAVILRCLEKVPEMRFHDGFELAQALDDLR